MNMTGKISRFFIFFEQVLQKNRKSRYQIMSFNRSNRQILLAGILIVLGALIIVTPWYIFPICEVEGITSHPESSMSMGAASDTSAGTGAGTIMKCGYTARAEAAVGALVILAGLTLLALPGRDARRALGVNVIGLGVVTVLIPTILIGVCSAANAPCRIGTLPALILLGVLTAIAGIFLVFSRDEPKTSTE
jgi:hypothetical protein